MECKICGSHNVEVVYNGKIRDGKVGQFTKQNVPVYKCQDCDVMWHDNVISDLGDFYESAEYRNAVDDGSEEKHFYELHDGVAFDTFKYTGTKIFRNKIVADIGCAAGAFLDFVKGSAKKVIGIEPSEIFRNAMQKKGFDVFPYAKDAKSVYGGKVDIVTSFDVIEHVEDPESFLKDAYDLLTAGGVQQSSVRQQQLLSQAA